MSNLSLAQSVMSLVVDDAVQVVVHVLCRGLHLWNEAVAHELGRNRVPLVGYG